MKLLLRHIIVLIVFLFSFNIVQGQEFRMLGGKDYYTTNFKLINNLIILPLEVNGSELTFILDSGVKNPVIFNLTAADSLQVNNVKTITIRGLGGGDPVEALHSKQNRFKLGSIYSPNQDLYIVYNNDLEFSSKLGIPVHGLIGYTLLKDFVVTIDYALKRITFTKPRKYRYRRCRKCEKFDLEFYKSKPYIQAKAKVIEPMNKELIVNLLIDSGGSDSVWLFEDEHIKTPKKSFKDFIGQGLSGNIFGRRSKLKSFSLKSFVFEEPNVAYLDSVSTIYAKKFKKRNGSIGGNILKRFKVVFDYPRKRLTLKKNSLFKEEFGYNLSGIELMHYGKEIVKRRSNAEFTVSKDNETKESNTVVFDYNYKYELKPIYRIFQVREESPAEKLGIRKGDILVKINGIYAYNFSLQELHRKFYAKERKKVRLLINRNDQELSFELVLEDLLN